MILKVKHDTGTKSSGSEYRLYILYDYCTNNLCPFFNYNYGFILLLIWGVVRL